MSQIRIKTKTGHENARTRNTTKEDGILKKRTVAMKVVNSETKHILSLLKTLTNERKVFYFDRETQFYPC